MPEKILVSGCLLGLCCRYDGKAKSNAAVTALLNSYILIPVCPEQLGGLSTPRPPAERQGEQVINKAGQDVTAQYKSGAAQVVQLAKLYDCKAALLKAKSPACGNTQIYDGTFTGTLQPGMGVAAQQLQQAGIAVFNETQIAEFTAYLAQI